MERPIHLGKFVDTVKRRLISPKSGDEPIVSGRVTQAPIYDEDGNLAVGSEVHPERSVLAGLRGKAPNPYQKSK